MLCRKCYVQLYVLCIVLMQAWRMVKCDEMSTPTPTTTSTSTLTSTPTTTPTMMMMASTAKEMIRERYNPPLNERIPANITITVDHDTNSPNNASEVVFDLRSIHTLLCTANEPVRWLLRSSGSTSSTRNDNDSRIDNVFESNVTIAEKPYAILLQLNSTMHDNAGYYHCVRAIKLKDVPDPDLLHLATFSEMVKRRDAARLYVHVNDVHEVHAFQYGDVVIPCRRTIPTVEVQLIALRVLDTNYSSNNNNNNNDNINFTRSSSSSISSSNNNNNNNENDDNIANAVSAATGGDDDRYIVLATSQQRWQRQNYPPHNIYTSIEYDRERGFIIRRVERLGEHFLCVARNGASGVQSSASFRVHLLGFVHRNESAVMENFAIDDVARKDIDIRVDYVGDLWPDTNVSWTQEGKGIIVPSQTRQIISNDKYTTLTIRDAELEDNAEYTLTMRYQLQQRSLRFNVSITDMPAVNVSDEIVAGGSYAHLTCRTVAHPKASVTWLYRACLESCDMPFERFDHHATARPGKTRFEHLHDIIFKPPASGVLRCEALNDLGKQTGDGNVFISNDQEDLAVTVDNPSIVIGDKVRLTCAARYYKFDNNLVWYKDDELFITEGYLDIHVEDTSSNYTYRRVLIFDNIELSNAGRYSCVAQGKLDESEFVSMKHYVKRAIEVKVHAPQRPQFNMTNLNVNKPIKRKLGERLELVCRATALSRANITWYKENALLNTTNEQIQLMDEGRRLSIEYLKSGDEGNYKCVASNPLGTAEVSTEVIITDLPAVLTTAWIFGIVAFCIALVMLVIYLTISVYRERKLANELKAAGLALFEEGDLGNFNPLLSLGEQADLLPYDRRFEFPKEKLQLGRQLGAGTFGVVYEAQAEGILPDEDETCVAVKMVKRGADNETLRALVTELKILIHIGRHLNVVNLLGAVTQNIAKRELMVIVEHCRYGNVKDFLLKNREHFIDQINQSTDRIDAKIIGHQTLQPSNGHVNTGYQSWSSNELLQSNDAVTLSTSVSGNYLQVPSLNSDKANNTSTASLASTLNDNATITTSDLVSWAFQVARGMHYLANVRVVHGDLAARNLLLCSDNVVKICDFGLAHSLYKEEYYKKRGDGLLPIKWLSPESMSDNIFDVHTDVWSFGIVLWELFSLARVPYPGLEPNIQLYEQLKNGYRMEKPIFANEELYDIMMDCWNEVPKERPLFDELEKKFARILGEEVTNHYITLSEDNYFRRTNTLPYMKKNGLNEPITIDYAILDKKQTVALQDLEKNCI